MRGFFLCLLSLTVGVLEAEGAQIQVTPTSFYELGFYADGQCGGPGEWCGHSWDIEYGFLFPGFDDSLGDLDSVSIEALFLFNVQADYTIYESAVEVAPFVSGRHNGVSVVREATQCVGLPVGSNCPADYGVFSQVFTEEVSGMDAESVFGSGSSWRYHEFNGGFGHQYGYQALGDGDASFVADPTIVVTYTYTPVPEASTALLFGLGVAGLAVRRRR